MKEQLLQLYRDNVSEFKRVIQQFPHDELTGPFLMSPPTSYNEQLNPLLIVGQETGGWSCFVDNPEKQMDTYESFNNGKKHTNEALWNTVRKVETVIGNDSCTSAWTNISKFDLYGGRSHGKYEKAIARLDNLLLHELEITNPKLCLFFTGPHFDVRLTKIFEGLRFEPVHGWEPQHLCRLIHEKLPIFCFRSYHPRFLRLKGIEHAFLDFIAQVMIYETSTTYNQLE
jgi:hypothetical protein